mmetsp:Transcript_56406/g.167524  ORF Transcript_56406/g.167524 Transcript_56406/m.167524 type:complete len:201 (-) Transcript_56406:249-851(-)
MADGQLGEQGRGAYAAVACERAVRSRYPPGRADWQRRDARPRHGGRDWRNRRPRQRPVHPAPGDTGRDGQANGRRQASPDGRLWRGAGRGLDCPRRRVHRRRRDRRGGRHRHQGRARPGHRHRSEQARRTQGAAAAAARAGGLSVRRGAAELCRRAAGVQGAARLLPLEPHRQAGQRRRRRGVHVDVQRRLRHLKPTSTR